jgi:hypothetical protein
MAAIPVDLPDCVDASTFEVGLETKETASPSPSAAVLETLKVLDELFPWWSIRPPMRRTPVKSNRPNSASAASDSSEGIGSTVRNIVRITHFISFRGEHLPATAENYAADVAPYSAEAVEKLALAAQSTNSHDRNAYALQAGMYARRAAHNAFRAKELGFRFPELTR